MTAPSLTRNPFVDIVLKGPEELVVNAFSTVRGFTQARLERGRSPGFSAALRLLQDSEASHPLGAAESLDLWSVGLLALPAELPVSIAADAFPQAANSFARDSFVSLPGCVGAKTAARLAAHFAAALANGRLRHSSGKGPDRDVAHNDPAGRVMIAALRKAIGGVVGHPVKPSYSFASLYREGAELQRHTDRPQCEYTLSILVDYDPAPGGAPAPWPVQLFPPGKPARECRLPVGGGLLFRGRHIPHARPPLPAGHRCRILLLHYVDADFTGELD